MSGAVATATMLEAALDYARRGWPVFPVHTVIDGRCSCGKDCGRDIGKHPKITDWPNQATTDPATIRQWWTRPGANIGIPTGTASGFFVLDVDPRHSGDDTLRELEAQHGPLPATVESLTGGGGRHILFRYPGYPVKSSAGVVGPGLDIRGDGGLIVAPQSLHVSGRRYEWEASSHPEDVAIAEAPAWLLTMLTAKSNGNGRGFTVGDKIKQGERNDTLYREARSMKAKGLSDAAILAALRAENQAKCQPPLPDAEIEKIVKHAIAQPDRLEFAANGTPGPEEQTQEDKSLKVAVVEYRNLLTLELPERKRYLPWLAERSNTMIYGPRGVGKTMANLGLATALVSGTEFLKWPVTEPVGVLYVDGEMQLDDLRTRATAFLASPPKAPLYFLTSELVYHRLHRDLALTTPAVREEIMRILEQEPDIRVVIFDNISSLCTGIDEQSKRDWEPIAAWLTRLRHRGLTTTLVHHGGKSGDQRGTSGREDSLDIVIRLDRPVGYDPREGCHFELRFTKSRGVKGDDVASLDIRLADDKGKFCWTVRLIEESHFDRVNQMLAEGVTSPTEIAEELGITKGYASKLVRKVRAAEGTA